MLGRDHWNPKPRILDRHKTVANISRWTLDTDNSKSQGMGGVCWQHCRVISPTFKHLKILCEKCPFELHTFFAGVFPYYTIGKVKSMCWTNVRIIGIPSVGRLHETHETRSARPWTPIFSRNHCQHKWPSGSISFCEAAKELSFLKQTHLAPSMSYTSRVQTGNTIRIKRN